MEKLVIAGREFTSRLFLGTGKFDSNDLMARSIMASGTEMVTVAMKRIELEDKEDDMLKHIVRPEIQLLPNTSGVRNAEEAVFAAQMAREAFGTNWLKLEIHPDPRYLLPDSTETLKATEQLVKLGFVVLPYCQADPTLCKHLEEAGAATVMPLGAPIGTNKGLQTRDFLRIIIEQANVPVVVDAGIGALSGNVRTLQTQTASLPTAGKGIESLLGGFDALNAYNESLTSGAKELKQNAPVLDKGVETLQSGTKQLAKGVSQLSGQLSKGASTLVSNNAALNKGTGTLLDGVDELFTGAGTLQSASGQVADGITQLADGAKELADGASEFEEDGTKKLKDTVKDDLMSVIDRIKALSSSDCTYDTFSGKADGVDSNVKFIIETDPIE